MVPDTQAAAEIRTRLVLVEQEIAITARAAGRDPASVKLVAVTKTVPARPSRRRSPRVSASSAKTACRRPGKMAALKTPPRSRAASDRTFAIEQGARSRRACSSDRDGGPAEDRARSCRGDGAPGKRPRLFVQVNTGEEPQKAGIAAARYRSLRRAMPRRVRSRHRRADVHPAVRRGAVTAFRAAREDREHGSASRS